jgi:hypothetical protein
MDKLEIFKGLMPFIPARYRRPLLLFIHIDELTRIINSMNECLHMKTDIDTPADMSKLVDLLKSNMPAETGDMMSMLLPLMMSGGENNMDNISSLFSAFNSSDTNSHQNTDSKYTSQNTSNEFSDEIDEIFKDFIDETRNDYE